MAVKKTNRIKILETAKNSRYNPKYMLDSINILSYEFRKDQELQHSFRISGCLVDLFKVMKRLDSERFVINKNNTITMDGENLYDIKFIENGNDVYDWGYIFDINFENLDVAERFYEEFKNNSTALFFKNYSYIDNETDFKVNFVKEQYKISFNDIGE